MLTHYFGLTYLTLRRQGNRGWVRVEANRTERKGQGPGRAGTGKKVEGQVHVREQRLQGLGNREKEKESESRLQKQAKTKEKY